MQKTVHLKIRGRVQGVGFRYFVQHHARKHQLQGWVRNLMDGNVEAVFHGDPRQVDAMIDACRQGPSSSHVESIDLSENTAGEIPKGFEIR